MLTRRFFLRGSAMVMAGAGSVPFWLGRAAATFAGDMAEVEALHRQNGIASHRHVGRLVVPPQVARGATLIFEAVKTG